MAQLRDKKTSEFLFEGTPLQVATLAAKIGFDEVVFDDVGEHFDPQAVLDAHAELVSSIPSDASDDYKKQLADADKLDPSATKDASDAITEARSKISEE